MTATKEMTDREVDFRVATELMGYVVCDKWQLSSGYGGMSGLMSAASMSGVFLRLGRRSQ